MLSFNQNEDYDISNPVIDKEIDIENNSVNDIYISQIIQKEMHIKNELIILDKYDAEIDLDYLSYIKNLIHLLTEDVKYEIGYFYFKDEELLLISVLTGKKLYVIEVPDLVWRFYLPTDVRFH